MTDLSSSSIINDQSNSDLNKSINATSNSYDNDDSFSYETMRMVFIAIATITVLICLTICLTVCICICLKRRRKLIYHGNKDQLLPEQSKKSLKSPEKSSSITNGKPVSTVQQTSSNSTKTTATKPFYYDNLDDIPFIDESRPTSVIDIAQV